jgi:TM2 domain-containing membrane protein YozV
MNAVAGEMLFCRASGKQIHQSATACPGCGAVQSPSGTSASDKRIMPAVLLCFFLGWLGVHRFYVGKVGTGVLQLLTFGGFGIWMLIDFIMIVVGSFTDKAGNRITQWT